MPPPLENLPKRWTLRRADGGGEYHVSFTQLREWALEGRVDSADLVGPEGSADLRTAATWPELRRFLDPSQARSAVLSSSDLMAFGPRRQSDDDDDVLPDLTPLIDCVFLLLIFFMLTTTFSTQGGLRVKLPEAGAADSEVDDQRLTVTIDANGAIELNDEPIASEALAARLSQAVETSLRTTLIIRADAGVAHGKVVAVMDAARRAGVEKLLVAAEKKSTGR